METALISPAHFSVFFIPTAVVSFIIPIIGVIVFTYIMARRMAPLVLAAPDARFDRIPERIMNVLKIWLAQWRHPRYMLAGVLHIMIFFGFLSLALRSSQLVILGFVDGFTFPGMDGAAGTVYGVIKDIMATVVLVAVVAAAIRRGIFKPERYAVPKKYGHDHTAEAVFVLALIGTLMLSESLFEASLAAAQARQGLPAGFLTPGTLGWVFKGMLLNTPVACLQNVHIAAYFVHDLCFFFFLCFLPLGKHFHVITSIFNVFFMRLDRGNVKPVRYGVTDEKLDELESFGVKKLEDFTWKHILDFYTCADCGRCADQCPANTVGRPLSPRFISIKARDLVFKNYPLLPLNSPIKKSEPLIGTIFTEDEIWS
ncbi:MAG: electron transfer flavoprotein, partial [Deltaproteobacteria bacterium]